MNDELRLLIIDDNPAIHQDFLKVLTSRTEPIAFTELDEKIFGPGDRVTSPNSMPEFRIDTAHQGHEGIHKIQLALKEGKPYALAFVDIRMPPGWDGLETIKEIWKLDKEIQVVICTAYSDFSWDETVEELGICDNLLVLRKPFDKVAVRQLACALTKKWLLAKESKNHTETLHKLVAERTQSLLESLSLLRATIESSTDGILVVDLSHKIVDYNQKLIKLWDIPKSIMETKDANKVMDFISNKLVAPEKYTDILTNGYQDSYEFSVKTIEDKHAKIFECHFQPHLINNQVVGRVCRFRDITDRTILEKKLAHQAMHDALTGLPNRILLNDRLLHSIAYASHHKEYFALIFIDLDRFKLVNDSLGHESGDKLLKEIAHRLTQLIRGEDTLARLGGDEFVLIVPGLGKVENAVNVAQKLLASFNRPFVIDGRNLNIGASIGVSIYPTNGKTSSTLLKNADIAMYQAKEKGGNQFNFYTDKLNQKINDQLQLENALRKAISHKEFFLVYQPQFDLLGERLLAVEALIRWQHPKKGVILPLDFIPFAEETGLIIPIGYWVIEEVCKQLKLWKQHGLSNMRVAINVSTPQLRQGNFDQKFKELLTKYEVDPKCIEIEITENVIIANHEVHKMIKQLKKLGLEIVLDDFGTGNSSLNHLKNIDFDRLKIDKSFVQNIAKSRNDEVIIEAIIAMARSLNFKVIAEGVETSSQMNYLKNQQCDELQGFLLSKPLLPKALEKIIKGNLKGKHEKGSDHRN